MLGSTPPAAIVTLQNMRRRNCHDNGSTTPNEMMLLTLVILPLKAAGWCARAEPFASSISFMRTRTGLAGCFLSCCAGLAVYDRTACELTACNKDKMKGTRSPSSLDSSSSLRTAS